MRIFLTTLTLACTLALVLPHPAEAAPKCKTNCKKCSTNMGGTWRYYLEAAGGDPSAAREVTLTRQGNSFTGSNNYHTFWGSTRGKWINFVMVVSGEEIEGFVRKVDGAVHDGKIAGVYRTSEGETGSFTALKIS